MTTVLTLNGSHDLQLFEFTLTATGIVVDGEPNFEDWQTVGQFLQRANGAV